MRAFGALVLGIGLMFGLLLAAIAFVANMSYQLAANRGKAVLAAGPHAHTASPEVAAPRAMFAVATAFATWSCHFEYRKGC